MNGTAVEKRLLRMALLETLVRELARAGTRVLAPVKTAAGADFSPVTSLKEMTWDYIATVQSAKAALFPRVDVLYRFRGNGDNLSLEGRDLSVLPPTVILGSRPCDAAAISQLSALFCWDMADPLFKARLDKTTLISISCAKCDKKCFCTSVKGSPGATEGSDILLTRLEGDGFLAEIITEKGRELAFRFPELFEPAPATDKEKFLAQVPVAFALEAITDNIGKGFENEAWLAQSLRCIGCGACAYVCPTCACFDIQDNKGLRKRSWDSCGFSLFTLHTSGHNPRETQDARWRQRVTHKFSIMPERQKVLGCVGCGRCGRACPTDMDLKEHLADLAKALKT